MIQPRPFVDRGEGVRWTFARGGVRHVEHRTLHLPGWMRVHGNTEPRDDLRALGIAWVD